jgi:hypothetical protein
LDQRREAARLVDEEARVRQLERDRINNASSQLSTANQVDLTGPLPAGFGTRFIN